MSRRDEFLREMGLAPIWRKRERGAEGPLTAVVDEDEVLDRAATPIDASAAPLKSRLPASPPIAKSSANAKPTTVSAERATQIARMSMDQLKPEVANCKACGLCETRKNTVFGVGDEQADWMIVGEAPGAEEDAKGEPFVGQAGKLLDNMLASVGLARGNQVYIANVLKCRPPGNRNPEPSEVAQCAPFLQRQIQLIQPKLIIAMGRFAAQSLLQSDATIGSMRGKVYRYQSVSTIVTYHPAYLLRSLPEKAKAWEDLCFARETFAASKTTTPGGQ